MISLDPVGDVFEKLGIMKTKSPKLMIPFINLIEYWHCKKRKYAVTDR